MDLLHWKRRERREPEFHYKTVQGYLERGKVPDMLEDGWELVSTQPVMLNGYTMSKQKIIVLRKKNPKFMAEPVAHD